MDSGPRWVISLALARLQVKRQLRRRPEALRLGHLGLLPRLCLEPTRTGTTIGSHPRKQPATYPTHIRNTKNTVVSHFLLNRNNSRRNSNLSLGPHPVSPADRSPRSRSRSTIPTDYPDQTRHLFRLRRIRLAGPTGSIGRGDSLEGTAQVPRIRLIGWG